MSNSRMAIELLAILRYSFQVFVGKGMLSISVDTFNLLKIFEAKTDKVAYVYK